MLKIATNIGSRTFVRVHNLNLIVLNWMGHKEFSAKSTISQALQNLKGTVLEALTRRLSKEDAQSTESWWKSSSSQPDIVDLTAKIDDLNRVESKVATATAVTDNSTFLLAEKNEIHLLHPIFGELLVDLEFKKVYLSNIKSLIQAPIWEKQRILRPERAIRIAKAKASKKSIPGIPGVITMYFDKLSGRCGIVDGQHRVAAIMLMAQDGRWDLTRRNILVDVFQTETEQEISNLFHEINSAEPVRLIDMPDEV